MLGFAKYKWPCESVIPVGKYLLNFSSCHLFLCPFWSSRSIREIKYYLSQNNKISENGTFASFYHHKFVRLSAWRTVLISPTEFQGTDFRSTCIYCAYTIFTLECKRSSSSSSCWHKCIFPSRHLLVLRRNRWVDSRGPFHMYEYIIIELRTMHVQVCVYII